MKVLTISQTTSVAAMISAMVTTRSTIVRPTSEASQPKALSPQTSSRTIAAST